MPISSQTRGLLILIGKYLLTVTVFLTFAFFVAVGLFSSVIWVLESIDDGPAPRPSQYDRR